MIAKLEHIKDEIINSLIMKKVVCPSAVQDVGTFGEHQNDQVSMQGFLPFSKGEYNENNEYLSVNEDDVASFLNLKDMGRKEISLIGHSSWCRKECNLLNLEGVFLVRGHVTTFNLKDTILDDIFGHDHVSLTIIYCLGDISAIMTI